MSAVRARFAIFVCCALLLALTLASVALGVGGTYQHTGDGKTTFWNDHPKPGETADWSGKRDREGYAAGFGTLIWYTAKGVEYARYLGNMVRGKFDGPVNLQSNAKTAHAFFIEGGRTTAWARGPVSVSPSETAPEIERTSRSSLFAPGPVRPIEQPGKEPESVHKQTSKPAEAVARRRSQLPSVDDELGSGSLVRENTKEEDVSPPIEPTPLPMIAAPTPSAKERKGVDDFLKSLVAPPPSLRTSPAGESPSP